MDHESQRRAWLLAAGAGLLTPALAAAASDNSEPAATQPNFPAQSAGTKHNDGLDKLRKILDGAAINSHKGISSLIKELLILKVISDAEAETLEEMTAAIFMAKSIDELVEMLKKKYGELPKDASAAATALASIAVSSAGYAKQFDKSFGFGRALIIVSVDFSTGLGGIATCAKVFPELIPFAALFGAIGGSGLALYSTMPKIDPVTRPPSAAK